MLREIQSMIKAEEIKHKQKRALANVNSSSTQLQLMH